MNKPKNIRCYDNGGRSADRYTVIYMDHPENPPGCFQSVGMSANPFHPQGVGQHGAAKPGAHLGRRIGFEELPPDCQKVVLRDLDIDPPVKTSRFDRDLTKDPPMPEQPIKEPTEISFSDEEIASVKALAVKLKDSQDRRHTGDDDGASTLEDLIDEAFSMLNGLIFRLTFSAQEPAKVINCPTCGLSIPVTSWMHPECSRCGHANAMIEGKCRDCDHVDPSTKGRVQYDCPNCGSTFKK